MLPRLSLIGVMLIASINATIADEPPSEEQLAGLKPYASFVGSWKGDGTSGTSAGWRETAEASWGYRKKDGRVSLNFYFEKNPWFEAAILTYDPKDKTYRFIGQKGEKKLIFAGKAEGEQGVRLLREEKGTDRLDRLDLKLTRAGDKIVLQFGARKSKSSFENHAQIEYFREGKSEEDFAKGPRCPVTGGAGRVEFDHEGRKIRVACETSKEIFLSDPKKYLAKVKNE